MAVKSAESHDQSGFCTGVTAAQDAPKVTAPPVSAAKMARGAPPTEASWRPTSRL